MPGFLWRCYKNWHRLAQNVYKQHGRHTTSKTTVELHLLDQLQTHSVLDKSQMKRKGLNDEVICEVWGVVLDRGWGYAQI